MTTISEDYVSFEVAKLLKKKGFPQSTFRCHYIIDGNVYYKSFENRCGFGDYDIIAPTLQMAMKWLREVHNIHIRTSPYGPYPNNDNIFKYKFEIITMFYETMICVNGHKDEGYKSNEQACEAAIKYCLENLI